MGHQTVGGAWALRLAIPSEVTVYPLPVSRIKTTDETKHQPRSQYRQEYETDEQSHDQSHDHDHGSEYDTRAEEQSGMVYFTDGIPYFEVPSIVVVASYPGHTPPHPIQ